MIREAKALEAAGCFSVVLECVPALVAAAVTRELTIPTIGIGAGAGTSGQARARGRGRGAGAPRWVERALTLTRRARLPSFHPHPPPPPQVLVYHDLLGMMQHPHHAKVTPKFCKQYAAVGAAIQEVRAGGWAGARGRVGSRPPCCLRARTPAPAPAPSQPPTHPRGRCPARTPARP